MAKRKTDQVETDQIIFEGVIPTGGSLHNGDKRQARVAFTASWTDDVRKEMDWREIPKGFLNCDLQGSVAISRATLTPNAPITASGTLKQHEEEFTASELSGFNLVTLRDKGGNITGRELRFTMTSGQLSTMGRLARYITKMGQGAGTLVCSIDDEPKKQGTLEGAETETENEE